MRARLFFFTVFTLLIFVSHASLLHLPLYWDELGQFVPAALDLHQHGLWIPQSTTPNSHPPGLAIVLAAVWSVFGYSIVVTRVVMLLFASGALLASFLLAIQLSRGARGAPAFFPPLLLFLSPLFYTQALLAQLDLPAMLFSTLALLLFLQERWRAAAAVCVVLVAMKETSIAVPLVFAGWLGWQKRWREAALFLLPVLVAGGWLAVLYFHTHNALGNAEYASYNLWYPLHPVRLIAGLLRRAYYLFFAEFRWAGTAALILAWRGNGLLRSPAWRLAALAMAAQTFLVTALGGATLERYLLPVLPVVYAAFAMAWSNLKTWQARVSQAILFCGLVVSIFWNPPYPFPFENNLAMVDFVGLQETAAEFLEENYRGARVASAWPFTDAVRRPEFGYVKQKYPVVAVDDFSVARISRLQPEQFDVFVLYCRTWDPAGSLLHVPWVETFLHRFYDYEPDITSEQLAAKLGATSSARWSRRGQWIEVFVRGGAKSAPPTIASLPDDHHARTDPAPFRRIGLGR